VNLEKDGGRVAKFKFQVVGKADDGYLFLQFPGNPDIFTQARFANEIAPIAIDAIHLMRDIPKNQIEIDVELPLPLRLPKTYLGFLLHGFINKVQNFIALATFHTAPSADGKFKYRR
jgi:hypothetical protein